MKSVIRLAAMFMAVLILFSSCASTTLIQSVPPGAKVYLNGETVGVTPYQMTDTRIALTCTSVSLEKEGYEQFNTNICRNEQVDVGAIIGGLFFVFPFLWTMKYNPMHTYELKPSSGSQSNEQSVQPAARTKAERIRELKQLLDDNLINQDEYEREKKKILDE